MKYTFLGHGMSDGNDKPLGSIVLKSLEDRRFTSFEAYVAFLSTPVARRLTQAINQFTTDSGRSATLCVGVDLRGTSQLALQELLRASAEIKVFYTNSAVIFHPKTYVFTGEHNRLIVGSSNATTAGWYKSIENSLMIEFPDGDPQGADALREISSFYGESFLLNARPLTQELIDLLVNSGVVPVSDTAAHPRKFSKAHQLGGGASAVQQLEAVFPRRRSATAPELVVDGSAPSPAVAAKGNQRMLEQAAIYDSPAALGADTAAAQKFWIETGMLTSASRNQLDLSMKDSEGHTGAVQMFEIDPTNRGPRSIVIRYAGRDYTGNTILYAHNNGTWRLQMKGTASGDKFTDVTRSGHFSHSILIFTKLGPDYYALERVDKDQLEDLKNKSAHWGRNRPASKVRTGRHFGSLQ